MAARASLTLPLALLVSTALAGGAHAADFDDMARCSSADVKALKVCSRCKARKFCSVTCQRADWPTHSKVCGTGIALRFADNDSDESE